MRVYAHWLDGDYRKVLTGVTSLQPWSPEDDRAERLLKTLALFGESLVLSDVQVVDSPVLWRLFSQDAFRRFLRNNADFLQLIARPMRAASERWSIATAGLERALKVGRIGSPMRDSRSVISLSEEIVIAGPSPDFDALLAKRTGSPDFEALTGFAETVRFFCSSMSYVNEPPPHIPHHSFYTVLEIALNNNSLPDADRHHVKKTLDLVNHLVVNPAERTRRSKVYERLDLSNPANATAWRLIVQAWNVAAQKSVCATGGSIGNMPGIPIGAYVDQPADVMLRGGQIEAEKGKRFLSELVPELPFLWDPGDLSWADILRISEHEQAADARSELRKAVLIGDRDATVEAVKKFADVIATEVIMGRLQRPIGWWVWAMGPVILKFGDIAASTVGLALFAGQVGERAMVWAVNKMRDRIITVRTVESAKQIGILPERTR